jgi:ribosomal protein S7
MNAGIAKVSEMDETRQLGGAAQHAPLDVAESRRTRQRGPRVAVAFCVAVRRG